MSAGIDGKRKQFTVRPQPPRHGGASRRDHEERGRTVYRCSAGHTFEGPAVSTSVRCPHCGEQQASW